MEHESKFNDLINEYVATVGKGAHGIAGKVKSIVHLQRDRYLVEFSELLATVKPAAKNTVEVSHTFLEYLNVIDGETFATIQADVAQDEETIQ